MSLNFEPNITIMKHFSQIINILILAVLFFTAEPCFAQRRPLPTEGRERIEVIKTTYLSRQMKLTPAQARLFWPAYDQYQEVVRSLEDNRRNAMHNMAEGLEKMSDDEINAMIDARINHAETALAARKKMIAELREFLPPRKIALFLRAEHQFNHELQKRIIERRNERLERGWD
jgi:Spy/CpxP family protein refolding chaperone